MPNQPLCNLVDIADPGARGFELEASTGRKALFVVRKGREVYAYHNSCPHTGVALEWQPDQFLDLENNFIQCALHGALFTVEKGYCVRGPCVGQSLVSLPVSVTASGDIYLSGSHDEEGVVT